jgi:hypothetical protein
LSDHLSVGARSFQDKRTKVVGAPPVEHFLDDRPGAVDRRDRLSAQAMHDLRVREQVA